MRALVRSSCGLVWGQKMFSQMCAVMIKRAMVFLLLFAVSVPAFALYYRTKAEALVICQARMVVIESVNNAAGRYGGSVSCVDQGTAPNRNYSLVIVMPWQNDGNNTGWFYDSSACVSGTKVQVETFVCWATSPTLNSGCQGTPNTAPATVAVNQCHGGSPVQVACHQYWANMSKVFCTDEYTLDGAVDNAAAPLLNNPPSSCLTGFQSGTVNGATGCYASGSGSTVGSMAAGPTTSAAPLVPTVEPKTAVQAAADQLAATSAAEAARAASSTSLQTTVGSMNSSTTNIYNTTSAAKNAADTANTARAAAETAASTARASQLTATNLSNTKLQALVDKPGGGGDPLDISSLNKEATQLGIKSATEAVRDTLTPTAGDAAARGATVQADIDAAHDARVVSLTTATGNTSYGLPVPVLGIPAAGCVDPSFPMPHGRGDLVVHMCAHAADIRATGDFLVLVFGAFSLFGIGVGALGKDD